MELELTVLDIESYLWAVRYTAEEQAAKAVCRWCKGKGSYVDEAFDGRTRVTCDCTRRKESK